MLLQSYGTYLIPGTIMHKMALLTASSIESYLPRRKIKLQKKVGNFSKNHHHLRVCLGSVLGILIFLSLRTMNVQKNTKKRSQIVLCPATSGYKLVPILLLLIRSPQNFLFVLSHAYNGCAGQTNEQVIYHMFILFQFSLKEKYRCLSALETARIEFL